MTIASLVRLRADKVCMMLEQDEKINLIAISVSCGFSEPIYFNSGLKMIYGINRPTRIQGEQAYLLLKKYVQT